MKKLLILSVIVIVNFRTMAQDSTLSFPQVLRALSTTSLISLPVPQQFNEKISYIDGNGMSSTKQIAQVKHDNTLLASFPDIVSSVTVYQVDEDGSLSFLGNTLSAKNSVYEVIYDFTQTQSITMDENTFILIGISVRMVAKVRTKSAGVNLASIEGLGIAFNAKKVSGSLEVRANGINSEKINAQIPVTTDLSPASISNALQSVATIKSHIYDSDTKITPQILAINSGLDSDETPKKSSTPVKKENIGNLNIQQSLNKYNKI